MIKSRSISGRLVRWLFFGAALVLSAASVFLYNEVSGIVTGSVDRTLHSKRQMITGLLHEEHGGIELELSDIIAGEYVIPRSGHYYRVIVENRVLAASPSLVNNNFVFTPADSTSMQRPSSETVYTSVGPDDEPVRVLRYQYQAFGRNFDITLAESLSDSIAMIESFRRYLFVAIPLLISVLCLTAWWIAKTSLRPIVSFSTKIEAITHKNLSDRILAEATAPELARLAQSFNAMLDRLNTVFESQRRLVADASHELKTPISVIRTQCDVALQRVRSAEEYADALRAIQSSSLNMTNLINDLLSLARLDAGLVSPESFAPVSLKKCVLDAIKQVGPLAAEKHVTVSATFDETFAVMGSRTALSEAFLNLIENAVRYNVEKGSVVVSSKKDSGRAVITVRDTGIGMREADLKKIFERFYRADTARSADGTGLGLSIVKSIVEAHAGKITVESRPGEGSSFTIILPVEPETARGKN